jgi:hypothetical protein
MGDYSSNPSRADIISSRTRNGTGTEIVQSLDYRTYGTHDHRPHPWISGGRVVPIITDDVGTFLNQRLEVGGLGRPGKEQKSSESATGVCGGGENGTKSSAMSVSSIGGEENRALSGY